MGERPALAHKPEELKWPVLPWPPIPLHVRLATQSAQWYAWGPPNMQCRLCASCWIYWKKYGGLKTPTQLEGAARGTTVRIDGDKEGASRERVDESFRRRPEHPTPYMVMVWCVCRGECDCGSGAWQVGMAIKR